MINRMQFIGLLEQNFAANQKTMPLYAESPFNEYHAGDIESFKSIFISLINAYLESHKELAEDKIAEINTFIKKLQAANQYSAIYTHLTIAKNNFKNLPTFACLIDYARNYPMFATDLRTHKNATASKTKPDESKKVAAVHFNNTEAVIFETELAHELLRSGPKKGLEKINQRIVAYCTRHKEFLLANKNVLLKEQLIKYHICTRDEFNDINVIDKFIQLLSRTLSDPRNISEMATLHLIFFNYEHIYDPSQDATNEVDESKNEITNNRDKVHRQARPNNPGQMFETTTRGRISIYGVRNTSSEFGITDPEHIPEWGHEWHRYKSTPHKYRVAIDTNSAVFKSFRTNGVPYIAGPSGTTADCMEGLYFLVPDLTSEEKKEYFNMLAAAEIAQGHHSMHEIILPLCNLNLYQPLCDKEKQLILAGRHQRAKNLAEYPWAYFDYSRSYESFLSDEFKNTPGYKSLLQKYPQYLDKDRHELESITTFLHQNKVAAAVKIQRFIRSKRAYKQLQKGRYWTRSELTQNQDMNLLEFKKLSKNNVKRLKNELGQLSNEEINFLEVLLQQNSELTHYTNNGKKIYESGFILSNTLLRQILGDGYFTNTSAPDVDDLANGDFVFFRYELKHINANESRFGDEQIIIDGDSTTLNHTGWVSLYDMIAPFSAKIAQSLKGFNYELALLTPDTTKTVIEKNKFYVTMENNHISYIVINPYGVTVTGKISDEQLKEIIKPATIDQLLPFSLEKISPFLFEILKITTQRGHTLKQDVRLGSHSTVHKGKFSYHYGFKTYPFDLVGTAFYGGDIKRGIALAMIRELRRIGGEFQRHHLTHLDPNELNQLLSNLFRVEAKLPTAVNLENVSHRYFSPITMREAIISNNLEQIKHLIENGMHVNQIIDTKLTPILYACSRLHDQCLPALQLLHKTLGGKLIYDGVSAAHVAAECGNLQCLQYCIDNGIDINVIDQEGNTVFNYACKTIIGHNLIQYLLSLHVQPTFEDICNIVKVGNLDALKLVFNHFPDLVGQWVAAKDKEKSNTLMHIAASQGATEIIKYLISKKSPLNAVNSNNETPLVRAILVPDAVMLLLQSGADLLQKDKAGNVLILPHIYNNGRLNILFFALFNATQQQQILAALDLRKKIVDWNNLRILLKQLSHSQILFVLHSVDLNAIVNTYSILENTRIELSDVLFRTLLADIDIKKIVTTPENLISFSRMLEDFRKDEKQHILKPIDLESIAKKIVSLNILANLLVTYKDNDDICHTILKFTDLKNINSDSDESLNNLLLCLTESQKDWALKELNLKKLINNIIVITYAFSNLNQIQKKSVLNKIDVTLVSKSIKSTHELVYFLTLFSSNDVIQNKIIESADIKNIIRTRKALNSVTQLLNEENKKLITQKVDLPANDAGDESSESIPVKSPAINLLDFSIFSSTIADIPPKLLAALTDGGVRKYIAHNHASLDELIDLQNRTPWVIGALRCANIEEAIYSKYIDIHQLSQLSETQIQSIVHKYSGGELQEKVQGFIASHAKKL